MPIALDPSQTFPVFLESDKEASPRPEFQFGAFTIRQRAEVYAFSDKFREDETLTDTQFITASVDLFLELCKGWSNMGDHDYSRESIESVLTNGELWELLYAAANNSHVSHDEKKS